ncbi:type II secretion system F family protein [Arthrobacter sp. H-02-3]|uniref:type II secretion system F family protein n=1 Tax=Arthrobacter sp. H-02-3 TaxID=2703675 RepID=UPI001F22257D|nr:type II secretion system F family protein [Arthrobacter sp. H-02-3]
MSPGLAGVVVAAGLAGAAIMVRGDSGRVRRRLHRQILAPADGSGLRRGTQAGRQPGYPGLRDTAMMLELIGAMLDAGAGLGRSLELIAALVPQELGRQLRPVVSALAIGADWDTAWHSSGGQACELLALRDTLTFAALTGAPSSALLYAQAARLRRERNRAAEQRAAALGVKLVVPLGLCSLPAFVCLGVVPVLLGLVPA